VEAEKNGAEKKSAAIAVGYIGKLYVLEDDLRKEVAEGKIDSAKFVEKHKEEIETAKLNGHDPLAYLTKVRALEKVNSDFFDVPSCPDYLQLGLPFTLEPEITGWDVLTDTQKISCTQEVCG